jgi:hypothetical protein
MRHEGCAIAASKSKPAAVYCKPLRPRHFRTLSPAQPISERFVSERDKIFVFPTHDDAVSNLIWLKTHWDAGMGTTPELI